MKNVIKLFASISILSVTFMPLDSIVKSNIKKPRFDSDTSNISKRIKIKRGLFSRIAGLAIILSLFSVPVNAQIGPGNHGNLNKATICTRDGDNYILRSRPGQKYKSKKRIPSGTPVVLLGESIALDGFTWRKINYAGTKGWVRGDYLCN